LLVECSIDNFEVLLRDVRHCCHRFDFQSSVDSPVLLVSTINGSVDLWL
jgi:hypothetical protein